MKQARKLQATLDGCNPKLCPLTDSLTGVKCIATSVAKKRFLEKLKLLSARGQRAKCE